MPANPKMDALSKLLADAKEISIEAEIGKEEAEDKCECGADLKCSSCGEKPSKCDC